MVVEGEHFHAAPVLLEPLCRLEGGLADVPLAACVRHKEGKSKHGLDPRPSAQRRLDSRSVNGIVAIVEKREAIDLS